MSCTSAAGTSVTIAVGSPRRAALVLVAAAGANLAVRPLAAQQPILLKSELDEYVHVLELEGGVTRPLVFRSPSTWYRLGPLASGADHLWAARYPLGPGPSGRGPLRLRSLPVAFETAYNSRYPSGTNDGSLWAGRGLNVQIAGGGWHTVGPLTITVWPAAYFAQNRSFDTWPITTPGANPYAYPWDPRNIDWPQRFGDETVWIGDWGQSGIRLDVGRFTAGVSAENMWWGPAVQNPILMSNTAPGFPHVDLGIVRPVSIGVGTLEARLVWGRLAESQYFDTVSSNNHRLFTGFALGLKPVWIPGLTLGLGRVLYTTWDSLRVVDFVDVFQPFFKDQLATPTDPEGSDDRDQILSLYARWLFPESGFAAYVEWSRNDHARNLRDFILEPDHSQAYTLGFEQLIRAASARWRLRGEWTHLGRSPTFQVRATPTFYRHSIVRQGYTHRGQILGAGIGPGSDAQGMFLDRYVAWGRAGLRLQRVRYNDDAYYRIYGGPGGRDGHDVELIAGLSGVVFAGGMDVGWGVSVGREINRYYKPPPDSIPGVKATNLKLQFSVTAR